MKPSSALFFRFDDIGPLNWRSLQLIDLMETLARPYVLGVIPSALNWCVKRRLRQTRHALIFQHGTTHKNQSGPQAPDEFPVEWGVDRITVEMRRGRHMLENALGQPIFGYIPPWNRISSAALQVLEQEGYKILSGDAMHPTPLLQWPVHVDVYASYRTVSVRSNEDIEREVAQYLQTTALVGVVLHPLSMPRSRSKQLHGLLRNYASRMVSRLPWETVSCQNR